VVLGLEAVESVVMAAIELMVVSLVLEGLGLWELAGSALGLDWVVNCLA
jgi:hypothetical protein